MAISIEWVSRLFSLVAFSKNGYFNRIIPCISIDCLDLVSILIFTVFDVIQSMLLPQNANMYEILDNSAYFNRVGK